MKFLALLRKEFRESVPWLLLAALILLAIGMLTLRAEVRFNDLEYWSYQPGLTPGVPVNAYRFLHRCRLEWMAMWLAFIAPGLALALGIRHFWVPLYTQTWSFLLHRSVSRLTLLSAKLTATILAFVLSLGIPWSLLYGYACRPALFPTPEPIKMLVVGWLYIALGLLVYLGTALSALSTARWYTTRVFGLGFAALAFLIIVSQWNLTWIAASIILVALILLAQTVETFLTREF